MTMENRRTAQRFDLHLPLRVRTPDAPAGEKVVETRDVSHRGVFFWFDRTLEPGSEFEFVMVLPKEITGAINVQVKCLGKVIRTIPQEGSRIGVAAMIERYEFIRANSEQASSPKT